MDLKTFTAQIELMHQKALRQSASYEDKWLNTFHGGRESALDQVLKLLKGERRDDKKAAMQRIIELTYSEDWQNDKEAASEVMRLGRAMWADKSNKPRPRKIAIWHGDKILVTGTAQQLATLTGLHEKIVRKRARCGYTDAKKRTFRYVEESS